MSFAGTGPSPADRGRHPTQSSARNVGIKSRDGDSAYVEDSRRVQEAIKEIEQLANSIQKEAKLLANASGSNSAGKSKVHAASKTASSRLAEAQRMLQGFSGTAGLSVSEQNYRRLMQQKLTGALVKASQSVEAAIRSFEAAEIERSKRDAVAALAGPGRPQVAASAVELHSIEASSGQEQRTAQLQDIDLSAAETEIHVAIVDEFVQEIMDLEQGIKGLQRAMVDLAEHAQAQGEVLDNIEVHTLRAAQSTAGATEQLNQTAVTHRRGTKLLYWLMAIAVLLAVMIIFVVARKH